jgi:hypothetical protein
MTYKKNFVLAVKVNGKILRESGEEVQLPFGSEYSILLKNLNPVRAMAQISIDGKEATTWLVLPANGEMEVERFLRSDNLKQGNRFKFIERTQAVEDHRGVQLEDGLLRVEFKKERVVELPKIVEHHTYHYHDYYRPFRPRPFIPYNSPYTWCSNTLNSGRSLGVLNKSLSNVQAQSMMLSAQCSKQDENTAGITAAGAVSNQQFVSVSGFQTEASEVLTLKLIGKHGKVDVQKPVTVDLRATCQTCGKRAKVAAKFCSHCGTSLQII